MAIGKWADSEKCKDLQFLSPSNIFLIDDVTNIQKLVLELFESFLTEYSKILEVVF